MREMKSSGVEWMEEIPENWTTRKLFGLLDNMGSGTTPKGEQYYEKGTIPWLNTGDLTDGIINETSKMVSELALEECSTLQIHKAGAVVIAMYGATIGKLGITNVDLVTNQACCVMNPSKELNKLYLFYLLMAAKDYFVFSSYGAGQSNISQNTIRNLKVPFCNIREQGKIAVHLNNKCSQINKMIEQQEEVINRLNEYKTSVITQAVTIGFENTDEYKESDIEWIEMIPAHWKSIKLKYCTYIRARLGWKGLKADEYVEEGYPLLSAFNIVNSKLDFSSNINFINQYRYDESPEIKLNIGDVLLVKDGAGIGKCAIVDQLPLPSTTNGSLAVISTNSELNSKFLYYFLMSSVFQKYIDRLKDGMGVPHLFQSDLKEIRIVIPSVDEQKMIVEKLDNIIEKVDKTIDKKRVIIYKLQEYKKSLIYEVVTGKKEV